MEFMDVWNVQKKRICGEHLQDVEDTAKQLGISVTKLVSAVFQTAWVDRKRNYDNLMTDRNDVGKV